MIYIPGANFKLKQNSTHPLFKSANHYHLITINKFEGKLKYVFLNKTTNVKINLTFENTEKADLFLKGLEVLSK
jgi:hypothetical protein